MTRGGVGVGFAVPLDHLVAARTIVLQRMFALRGHLRDKLFEQQTAKRSPTVIFRPGIFIVFAHLGLSNFCINESIDMAGIYAIAHGIASWPGR